MVVVFPNNNENFEKFFSDIASKSTLPKILLVSTQLGANYDMWANEEIFNPYWIWIKIKCANGLNLIIRIWTTKALNV